MMPTPILLLTGKWFFSRLLRRSSVASIASRLPTTSLLPVEDAGTDLRILVALEILRARWISCLRVRCRCRSSCWAGSGIAVAFLWICFCLILVSLRELWTRFGFWGDCWVGIGVDSLSNFINPRARYLSKYSDKITRCLARTLMAFPSGPVRWTVCGLGLKYSGTIFWPQRRADYRCWFPDHGTSGTDLAWLVNHPRMHQSLFGYTPTLFRQ